MDNTVPTDSVDNLEPPSPMDTGEREMPHVYTAGERETLEGMLEWYRAGVQAKLDGMTQDHATASPVRSGSSVAGVVKHLAVVEDAWFTMDLAGEGDPWAHVDWEGDRDWEWRTARDEPVAQTAATYRRACERSRSVAAERDLDAVATSERGGDISLRWVYVHLLEETARHLGHMDVLRELADGTTGE